MQDRRNTRQSAIRGFSDSVDHSDERSPPSMIIECLRLISNSHKVHAVSGQDARAHRNLRRGPEFQANRSDAGRESFSFCDYAF